MTEGVPEGEVSDADLERELRGRSALVVHFSHHSNMPRTGRKVEADEFPGDMLNAIAISKDQALSCTVVWPGHGMEPVGSVGIVFAPKVANVLSAHPSDAGTFKGRDGEDVSLASPLRRDSLLSTFEPEGRYNEWRVKGAEVIGIYIDQMRDILVKRPLENLNGEIAAETVTLDQVLDWLPGMRVFFFHSGHLCELFRDSSIGSAGSKLLG